MHINFNKYLYIKILEYNYKIFNKFRFPLFIRKYAYNIYFNRLLDVLIPYFKCAINKLNNVYYKGHTNSKIIWIFWWQGYFHMPNIVHKCINSIKNNANGYTVILITKDNIFKYSTIPNYIYKAVHEGNISLTHLSDILRFNLLNNYGGLWCDSTLYCSSNIKSKYFNYFYSSGGYKNTIPKFVHGKWTGFLIGGNRHNALFQFMCNYFYLYWKNNKYQINYFMIDLGLYYAYLHNIGEFKQYINTVACNNNPDLFKLVKVLNKPFNRKIYCNIIKHTNMFKLNHEDKFNDNTDTFYSYLMHDKL